MNKLNYEPMGDGHITIYSKSGGILVSGEHYTEDLDRAKLSAYMELLTYCPVMNPMDLLGLWSKDLPFLSMEDDMVERLKAVAILHGTYPFCRATELAKERGVSRQAISQAIYKGRIPSIKILPDGSLTVIDTLLLKGGKYVKG